MAHAASNTKEPVEQGLWGIFEVFVDTIIICTLTSMAVLLSGVLENDINSYGSNGAAAAAAFNAILPGTIGGTVLQISLLFFALSTILGWSYYGERCGVISPTTARPPTCTSRWPSCWCAWWAPWAPAA